MELQRWQARMLLAGATSVMSIVMRSALNLWLLGSESAAALDVHWPLLAPVTCVMDESG